MNAEGWEERLKSLVLDVQHVALSADKSPDQKLYATDLLVADHIKEENRLGVVEAAGGGKMKNETLDFFSMVGLNPGPWRKQPGFLNHVRTGVPCVEVVNADRVVIFRLPSEEVADQVVAALNDGPKMQGDGKKAWGVTVVM